MIPESISALDIPSRICVTFLHRAVSFQCLLRECVFDVLQRISGISAGAWNLRGSPVFAEEYF